MQSEDFIAVHGALLPNIPLNEQPKSVLTGSVPLDLLIMFFDSRCVEMLKRVAAAIQ